jgi:hypothetical protein
MSELGKEIKALRIVLAEQGVEVTLERLVEVLEKALKGPERACARCMRSPLGLCVDCLMRLVKEKP